MRTGQGKKTDDFIEQAIVETLVSMWLAGKRKRELSAESLLDQLANERHDLTEHLPSPQTVRRLTKDIKDRLDEISGDQDQPWSIAISILDSDEINDDALPLLLRINKHLALDVGEERQRNGFRTNRLSLREARWVCKLRNCLAPQGEKSDQAVAPDLEALVLVDLARKYATRELVAQVLGERMDTYDLDMEMAFNVPLGMRSGSTEDVRLWMLSLEMGLISHGPISSPMKMLERAIIYGGVDQGTTVDHSNPIGELLRHRIFVTVLTLMEHGVRIRVQFGSDDWRGMSFQELYSFGTHGDYDITLEVLWLILPLARVDGVVTKSDSDQVRIATAFLKKVQTALREKMEDPKVREILGLTNDMPNSSDLE